MKVKGILAVATVSVLVLGVAHASDNFYFRLRPSVQILNQESFSVRIAGDHAGVVGSTFSAKAEASSPRETLRFSLTGGSLPPGVSLNSVTGDIGGLPSSKGRFSATITAEDAFSTASAPLLVDIYDALEIQSMVPPFATVGKPYSASFAGFGGNQAYAWTLTGETPVGLIYGNTSAQTSTLSGTPTAPGVWDNIHVDLADTAGHSASSTDFSISVANPLKISGSPSAIATVGQFYSATFTASGGHLPLAWSLAGGALPDGLAAPSNGTISGVPTAPGTFPSLAVRVSDAAGDAVISEPFSIVVSHPLALTGTPASTVNVGSTYSASFNASGGRAPYEWTLSGSLPEGLSFSNGIISGQSTAPGTWNDIVVKVSDKDGRSAQTQPFSIVASHPACVAQNVQWSACSGSTTGPIAYNSSQTVTNAAGGYTGSTTVTCGANGVLSQSGATCSQIVGHWSGYFGATGCGSIGAIQAMNLQPNCSSFGVNISSGPGKQCSNIGQTCYQVGGCGGQFNVAMWYGMTCQQ